MLLSNRLCTAGDLQSLASERIWRLHQKKLQSSCYKTTWPHKTLNSLIQMLIWYAVVFVLTWLPRNPTHKIIYNHARSVSPYLKVVLVFFLFFCSVSRQRKVALQWRDDGREGVSNHQPRECLPNRLFRHRSKKTSKLPVTGLCAMNSLVTGQFPAQMVSNPENSIWWRRHGLMTWSTSSYVDHRWRWITLMKHWFLDNWKNI